MSLFYVAMKSRHCVKAQAFQRWHQRSQERRQGCLRLVRYWRRSWFLSVWQHWRNVAATGRPKVEKEIERMQKVIVQLEQEAKQVIFQRWRHKTPKRNVPSRKRLLRLHEILLQHRFALQHQSWQQWTRILEPVQDPNSRALWYTMLCLVTVFFSGYILFCMMLDASSEFAEIVY